MGSAIRGLTGRGKSLIMVGLALVALTFLLGVMDLMRVALLLLLLPPASALVLARTRYQLNTSRKLSPPRVSAGESAQVKLRLRNRSRFPTGSMMLEDRLPYALGERPRLVLERLLGGARSSVTYRVSPAVRGQYELGPLLMRLTDPFGLVELVRSYPAVSRLTVTPVITPLPAIRFAGDYSGNGQHRSRSVAVHGEDDAATREYRRGDDLRRVHWRSTAHSGQLMVRREEQPWESHATVLLDLRATAHHGHGHWSSFEWAVSATASITAHLRRGGYKTRLVSETTEIPAEDPDDGLALDYLSAVQPRGDARLDGLTDRVTRHAASGLMVAVFGSLSHEEAAAVGALRQSGTTCVALLLDSSSWLRLDANARADAERRFHEATLTLVRHGWQVQPIRHGDELTASWRSLATGRPGGVS